MIGIAITPEAFEADQPNPAAGVCQIRAEACAERRFFKSSPVPIVPVFFLQTTTP